MCRLRDLAITAITSLTSYSFVAISTDSLREVRPPQLHRRCPEPAGKSQLLRRDHLLGLVTAGAVFGGCNISLRRQRVLGVSLRAGKRKGSKRPKRPAGEAVPGLEAKKPDFEPAKQVGVTAPLGFFDPIGLCPKDETVFNEYRACEIKHGRVAMMASLGAVTQHYVRFPGFDKTSFGEPMPAGLAAVTETPATFYFFVLLGLVGAVEIFVWREPVDDKGKWLKEPGNYGDPLGLGQYDEEMRNREINNGRMAMFAAFGIIAAELVTGKDGIQQLGL
eukprot:TRINITY_DN42599_c0_g1_i1.p1 TRINITY_DN42599_c0_g1~~TRINITY_DN42599_c0_g1_i1.p1  ORF type:complete len:277 (+),score=54.13 TRINITY_DN42599_c0_g1_i1:147-977(+)